MAWTQEDEILRYIFDNCDTQSAEFNACSYRYEYLWYAKHYAPIVLPIVAVLLVVIFRSSLLDEFVSISAAMIKRKRRFSSQLADIKTRIDDKANE